MYLNINLHITIGEKVSFEVAKSIEINRSLQKLSNTAVVVLPREFKEAKGKRLLDYIHIGDAIKIELGYNGELHKEFEGYITNIGAEIPTILECEDEMYKLKRTQKFNHTFANASLKDILQFIAPNYSLDCVDMSFGKFMIQNATAFEVLQELKKYGIRCDFKSNVLHAGTLVDFKAKELHKFVFGKNIRKSSDLKYISQEKKECKIKAISLQKGTSKKVVYEFGEAVNGERTLHAPLNLNEQELKEWAENYYKSLVFNGYEGSVNGWGVPRTDAGDTLELVDPNYPDKHRDGKFLIESVTIKVNAADGFKRENKIGMKL
ncbi:hypothetical protein [Ornithobacterium rhinotracheale]